MSREANLKCYYCALQSPIPNGEEPKITPAYITIHDKRGCRHVCFEHMAWMLKQSWIGGHSDDCPVERPSRFDQRWK